MEAASVSVPGAMSGSDDSVDAPPVKTGKRGAFLAVPIPRVDPALGNGLLGVAAYIFKLNPADQESPPSVLGAGALWMDGGSVGAGIGGKLYMKEDRYRITGGALYADLHYDLVVNSTVTGEVSMPIAQTATGGLIHAQFRISPNSYMGARLQLGKLLTELRSGDAGQAPIEIRDQLGLDIRVNSLGPSFAYDTRDSNYYPRAGVAFDAGIDVYFNDLGSDISFNHYEANYRHYQTVREHDVLAWQAYVCAAGGEPPFFLQCQVGPNSLLRGYSFGVHRGDAMAAAQVEYRWQLHPRWIVAAFAGAAQVAPRFHEFSLDSTLLAGGAGVRFVVEPKNGVTLRLDYGVGEDEGAVYVSVGEAF
jgi:outer membrane protein assembly factor BamA